ncbi:TMEM144 [Symbiodinium microadriaticum]|nr:TMEM144 [Symbiodinium microadriaticum]
MCAGILMVGFVSSLIFGNFGMANHECLLIIEGGALWALSNYLVLPVVKLLGIGPGFSLYHFVNLVVGYVIGRFGIFGMESLHGNVKVCDAGCALVLVSFILMVFVESDEAPSGSSSATATEGDQGFREDYQRWRQDHVKARRPSVMEAAGSVLVSILGREPGTLWDIHDRGFMGNAAMEKMLDPLTIRFSQGNIGESFKDLVWDGTSIFETYEQISEGMQKREVPMMRVVQKDGLWVTLDNRRLAVYKMARHGGKCRDVKVNVVQLSDVEGELRKKSDSRVEGLAVIVRGTKRTVHADGHVYSGQYTRGIRAGQAQVSKVFKDGKEAYEDQFFDQDVALCEESIKIVEPFNKAKKFGSYVKVCRAAVWHLTRSKQRVLVEPFLSNFQNFNSNTGWQGSTNWSEALQSLSHFSYHHSQGDLVLCDLQGSVQDGEVVWTSALDLPYHDDAEIGPAGTGGDEGLLSEQILREDV